MAVRVKDQNANTFNPVPMGGDNRAVNPYAVKRKRTTVTHEVQQPFNGSNDDFRPSKGV